MMPAAAVALTDFEAAQIQISLVMMLVAVVSVLSALAARDQAKKAGALAEERHRDDQLRRLELSFDANRQRLVLTNTSTVATWDKVVIGVANHSEGPIVALGDAPPEPMGESPHHFINLGRVEAGDVRPIEIVRADEHRDTPAVVLLTCWQGDDWWRVPLHVDVPPPPPVPFAVWV